MSQAQCSECGREYDADLNSVCPYASSHSIPDVPSAAPQEATADSELPLPNSVFGLATVASQVPFDPSTDPEVPPAPPPPPPTADDAQVLLEGRRYEGFTVFLAVLGTIVSYALVAIATVGLGALLGLLVMPFVAGTRIRRATTSRNRSIWMGVQIGTLLIPLILFGVCFGIL